ncbi:MAG: hypothetical protein H6907_01180 [Hyphomicrobiales bacterium]|nr:hypothetical protein [Hyphomicrobiales bacterium]MCP5370318.1 hypothetical protein [Hyphomicrobiales bacterium]
MLNIPNPNGDFHLPAPAQTLSHRDLQALVARGRALRSRHMNFLLRALVREVRDLVNLDRILRAAAQRHMADYA